MVVNSFSSLFEPVSVKNGRRVAVKMRVVDSCAGILASQSPLRSAQPEMEIRPKGNNLPFRHIFVR